MNYLRALKERDQALAECLFAREQLRAAAVETTEAYRAHPMPVLGVAAGVGFLAGRLRLGASTIWAGARLGGGPAIQLLRNYFGGW